MRKLPELDQITAFLTVAEELSFRRAAERLGVDQSALSRRVKDLECRLGFQVFFRTTHAVRLTDAGSSFYDANRHLMDSLGDAIDTARRIALGSKGSLRIGYMTFASVALVPAAVREYGRAFPDVSLILSYQRTQAQKVSLARGELDIGLMLGPFAHSDYETAEVASERLVAMMADAHPLAACADLAVRDIAKQPLVLGTTQMWDYYRQVVGDILAVQGYRPTIAFEASNFLGILGLVRAGLGITLVPEVMAGFCPQGLIARHITDAEHRISTVAAWHRPASRKVMDFLKILRSVSRQPVRASTDATFPAAGGRA